MRYISDQLDAAEDQLTEAERNLNRLETAVRELRGALQAINLCQFNSMSSRSEMVRLVAEALKNTENV